MFSAQTKFALRTLLAGFMVPTMFAVDRLNGDSEGASFALAAVFGLSFLLFAATPRIGPGLVACLLFVFGVYCGPFLLFGSPLSHDMVILWIQTNPDELWEFSLVHHIPLYLGIIVLAAWQTSFPKKIWLKGAPVAFAMGAFPFAVINSNTGFVIREAYSTYQTEVQKLITEASALAVDISPSHPLPGKDIHVLVIGESLQRKYLPLYSGRVSVLEPYRSNLTVFSSVFSNHVSTDNVLTLALTNRNQYTGSPGKLWTLPAILAQASVPTHWITNQPLLSQWGNRTAAIAYQSAKVSALNKHVGFELRQFFYDDVVVGEFAKVLADDTGEHPRLIVVHLMGSHFSYCERYPDSFAPKPDTLACYAHSAEFTEEILRKLLERGENRISTLTFLSDHGEDPENGNGHNPAVFHQRMIEIPMFTWVSPTYGARHPELASRLAVLKNKAWTNDLLYDYLLDLIAPGFFATDFAPLSRSDELPAKPLTLHGKRNVED